MRHFLLVLVIAAGCAPRAIAVTPDHPAHPDAAPGRLAGPPAALRPGVATREEVRPTPPPPSHDHGQAPPAEPPPAVPAPAAPPAEPPPAEATKPPTKPPTKKPTKKPAAKKPAAPKPPAAPAKPAPTGHEGHEGHEGHH